MMSFRALIVDDSSVMRKIVCRSLAEAGLELAEVVEAADGLEALDKFDPEHIDLVLTDCRMPHMDGIDFVRELREMEDGKAHTPVVMVTIEDPDTAQAAAALTGADAYVIKPFTTEDIKDALDLALGSAKR